ncbi:hypothetical protein [Macrococcus equi]|uniref:hypothetical protein n=1 Tax=Macrococcus equi TaxID=3395462 RepID=UPI0039BEB061
MDNRKIIYNAVAGSGKTSDIIEKLNVNERSLIITYTNNNEKELISRVINKFGYVPENIEIKKLYTFLYSFCLKPNLPINFEINGITYKPEKNNFFKANDIKFYLNSSSYIYHNKISKFILFCNLDFIGRLNKFFDNIFIDEFQDLASDEVNLILKLVEFSGGVFLYGDFFQTTYSTSTRGNTNKHMKEDIEKFLDKYRSNGFKINTDEFIFSKRCPQSVTNFISNELNIEMKSYNQKNYDIKLLEEKNEIQKVIEDDNIPKLFYQKSNKYKIFSLNWGESKGLTFDDICVVLNKSTYKNYIAGNLVDLKSITKNKFYVACTRTTRNLYFVDESKLSEYKVQ